MPAPFAVSVWVLPLPRARQIDPAEAVRQVMWVLLANVFYMCRKRFFHDGGQHGSPILVALPLADQDLVAGEVNSLHSELQTLQQTEACPMSEAGHVPVDAVERTQQRVDLWSRQHDGETLRPLGADHTIQPA